VCIITGNLPVYELEMFPGTGFLYGHLCALINYLGGHTVKRCNSPAKDLNSYLQRDMRKKGGVWKASLDLLTKEFEKGDFMKFVDKTPGN
jgi:hypothetical protein